MNAWPLGILDSLICEANIFFQPELMCRYNKEQSVCLHPLLNNTLLMYSYKEETFILPWKKICIAGKANRTNKNKRNLENIKSPFLQQWSVNKEQDNSASNTITFCSKYHDATSSVRIKIPLV